MISASGAILAVLATLWGTSRREARQAERQHEQARVEARRRAYGDLLGPAMRLRVQVDLACSGKHYDLDAKLAAVQENAETVGLHASHVAVIAPPAVAEAARALAAAATRLSATVLRNAEMIYDNGADKRFVVGEIRVPPDFTEYDACMDALYRAIADDGPDERRSQRGRFRSPLSRRRALPR